MIVFETRGNDDVLLRNVRDPLFQSCPSFYVSDEADSMVLCFMPWDELDDEIVVVVSIKYVVFFTF